MLKIEICDAELKTAKVYREYQIDDSRRIDFAIKTSEKFIPIEVKIYASEQQNQCFDYYLEAKKHQHPPLFIILQDLGKRLVSTAQKVLLRMIMDMMS